LARLERSRATTTQQILELQISAGLFVGATSLQDVEQRLDDAAAACKPDAVADAHLFKSRERTDVETYELLYGKTFQEVLKLGRCISRSSNVPGAGLTHDEQPTQRPRPSSTSSMGELRFCMRGKGRRFRPPSNPPSRIS
jgi:hypothetical protein